MKEEMGCANQLLEHWGYLRDMPPELLKQLSKEYLSKETLTIYCDTSLSENTNSMAIACSYVIMGEMHIEAKRIIPPATLVNSSICGEVLAVISALQNFDKYLLEDCYSIKIYSDHQLIESLKDNLVPFRSQPALKALQQQLSTIFYSVKDQYPTKEIYIYHLPKQRKRNNPFHLAVHNASRKLIINPKSKKRATSHAKKRRVYHDWDRNWY
jgi:hypothetical protein